jgi:D-alanyl-D-alanine carboxypeptidase
MRIGLKQSEPGTRKRRRLPVVRLAGLLAVIAAGVPIGQASAHVAPPTLTALHAFVGDSLWGLDTSKGTLIANAPDERTAQASTTKIMTLRLTVRALEQGVVHLDDQVTIDALVAGIGGSTMADVNGVPLQVGEVVHLADLIRGMMYPSGNNAAWAIAEHVARAYLGPAAGVPDFVNMMNQEAVALGLINTHFANPNGFDNPNHYTTARELAKLMNDSIDDQLFQQIVGFIGTWNATTQAPGGGTKTYKFSFPFFNPFPGYEGAKGGGTTNCNGNNNGCMVMSGKRLGRRVVLGFMQGKPWVEETGLFNFAFATIFHPNLRATSNPMATAEVQESLDCVSQNRAVSAVLDSHGPARLVVWAPDVDGSAITEVSEAALPGSAPPGNGNGAGPPKAVALTHVGSSVILAFRKGAQVELSRWSLAQDGSLALLSQGIKLGPSATMAFQPVAADKFVSVVVNPDGALVVKSWAADSGGPGLTLLDTHQDSSRVYSEAAVAAPAHPDPFNGHSAITAAQDSAGNTVYQTWSVNQQTGQITQLGSLVEPGAHTSLSIVPLAVDPLPGEASVPSFYATAYRAGTDVFMRFYSIDQQGNPVFAGFQPTGVTSAADVRLSPLGDSGLMLGTRTGTGGVELAVWEGRRLPGGIAAYQISDHPAYDGASSVGLCRLPSTHAEGDYLASSIGASDGHLTLRAYRSGDRP